MSTMQLLRHAGEEGVGGLDVVDNPSHRRPDDFERDGDVSVPRFGTEDLILLADAMAEQGYRTTHLDLRDERFNVLDAEEEEELEDHLLQLLRQRDVKRALYFLAVNARGTFVHTIELSAPSGFRLRVNRDGIVSTNVTIEALRGDLTNSWWRVLTL